VFNYDELLTHRETFDVSFVCQPTQLYRNHHQNLTLKMSDLMTMPTMNIESYLNVTIRLTIHSIGFALYHKCFLDRYNGYVFLSYLEQDSFLLMTLVMFELQLFGY